MARNDPHLFGPFARKYFEDTVCMEREHAEIEAALNKVYGPDHTAQPCSVWQDRYVNDLQNEKYFRKWFRKNYG